MADRGESRGDWLFWSAALALALGAFFFLVRPAIEESRHTAKLHREIERETRELKERRDHLRLRLEALESDPLEIQRGLHDEGYTPEGRVRVVPGPAQDR